MAVSVQVVDGVHCLVGDWPGAGVGNELLAHLRARAFSPATVRAYAFDLANLARFLDERDLALGAVEPMDVFAWVDWQGARTPASGKVVRLAPRSAAPATINRRVAAVRAFFEFLVMSRACAVNPVPAPRRGQGLRPTARGMLGHLGPGRARGGGRLVREQRRLPESLDLADVQAFMSGLRTHRDRAMVLAMLLGGLRSAEVRGLLLKDVDQGRRRLRVVGKGGRERVVRSTPRSSPSSPPTCPMSDPAALLLRSASWCCAAPPLARGSAKRAYGRCSGGTGKHRERPGSDRTGCGTPTAQSWPRRGSICWHCGN